MPGDVRVKMRDVNVQETFQQMEKGAVINYSAEYAQYVEFPTSYAGGSQPPFQPLYEWVQRKWPDLGDGLKDAGDSPNIQTGGEEHQQRVAWIVVKAIAENGTDGVHFGQRGLEEAKRRADSIAEEYEQSNDPQAPAKIVAEVAEVGFNKGQAIISQEAADTGNLLQSGSIELVDDPGDIPSEVSD